MLASGPVEQGFESTWSFFFSFAFFLPILKPIRFFRFSVLVICSFLLWSDSVRTAAAVVIMYRFTGVPHVLYNSTIRNVLVTAVDARRAGSSPLFPAFVFLFHFFLVGESVNGCLSNVVLFTAAAGLQMSGFEPSIICFFAFFTLCFPFFFWR